MKIGNTNNSVSIELKMQEALESWIKRKRLKYVREKSINSSINRRADFILVKKSSLINIEAKCHAIQKLFDQLSDHSTYCDYCFAYIPDFCLTPRWWKKEIVKKGFGLIVYNRHDDSVTEVLEAHHQKPENINLRARIMNELKTKH